MTKKIPEPTLNPAERAFLVGVEIGKNDGLLDVEESLNELDLLSKTAGLDVVGVVYQKLNKPNPQTFIGSGKVNEIKLLVDEVQADVVIFDVELSPRHLRELEKLFPADVRFLDRTALILDIFAQHAKTREGALQVELAQYEYRLPRLTRAWMHLARQAGGGGGRAGSTGGVGLRGPGETQLEVDRRDIRRRMSYLKEKIEKVRSHRQLHRGRRKRSKIPVAALVGYTNAGKSTLLNNISDADVYVADKLFATLDPTTRRVLLPQGVPVLITDTVGFIQKLPTMLVAAFRATLEEIAESDLLIHMIDVTHPNADAQAESVLITLKEIHADHIPIITVLNKIDRLADPEKAERIIEAFPNSVAISALQGSGIDSLLEMVESFVHKNDEVLTVEIPYEEGKLISLFHEQGRVDTIEHNESSVMITGWLPDRIINEFSPHIQN